MALVPVNKDNLPKDVELLTFDQVVKLKFRIIESWDGNANIWALKWGPGLISLASAASATYPHDHFRRKLKVFNHGRIVSIMPIVALPAIASFIFHKTLIQTHIIAPRLEGECSVCLQLKAAAAQGFFACIYPSLFGPAGTFALATRYFTYRLPNLTKEPKELLRLYWTFFKPIKSNMLALLFFNCFLAMGLTWQEFEANFRLDKELMKDALPKE